MRNIKTIALTAFAILFSHTGCFTVKVNLTGASVHPDAKTFSVQEFINRADIVQPGLSLLFYETLRDKVESQTPLSFTNGYGDLNFEGEITRYEVTAQALTAQERAAQNRFTIGLRVNYTNVFEPENNFSRTFERYEEFEGSESIENVRAELTEKIVTNIIDDIFSEAFVNW
jgi:hypothetical protein